MAEMTVEQQLLGKIQTSVTNIERTQELLTVKLLGGVQEETKHGRLPMVEARVEDHDVRLESLERDRIKWKAYAAASAAIGGGMGAIASALIRAATELISRH